MTRPKMLFWEVIRPSAKVENPSQSIEVSHPEVPPAVADIPYLNLHPLEKIMRTAQIGTDTLDTRQLLSVLTAVKKGDFSARMPIDSTGMAGKIADTLNDVINQQERLTAEFKRISMVVGKEGKTREYAILNGASGSWHDCINYLNNLIIDLVQPTTEVARVIGAVAKGDLSQTMSLDIDGRPLTGEFLRTAKTVNTMVDRLGSF